MSPRLIRIIILQRQTGIWCDFCSLPSATSITYVVEPDGDLPRELSTLTTCGGCEPR